MSQLEPLSEHGNGISNGVGPAIRTVPNKEEDLQVLKSSVANSVNHIFLLNHKKIFFIFHLNHKNNLEQKSPQFDSCSVTDEHMDYVHFHVANPQTSWSHLFG